MTLEDKLYNALLLVEGEFMKAGMHPVMMESPAQRWLDGLRQATRDVDATTQTSGIPRGEKVT